MARKLIPPARQPARQPASPPAFANLITIFFLRKTWLKMGGVRGVGGTGDGLVNTTGSHIFQQNKPPGSHVFQRTVIIFELIQDIIRMNLLTKFHEDWTINVASRVHIKKNAPPRCSHVFQANVTIFKLIQNIIETNLLTKFHEDWTINVASRVLTRKNAPPPGGYVFPPIMTIFELAKNVTSRKTAPPPGGHVFSTIWTIFKLNRDINETNVLTKFHDDWVKIVTSRVFTRNTAPPPGGHIFQQTGTIFQLNQHLIKTNILTHFELSRGINGKNVLTKFHEDQTINVTSEVFTRQMLTQHDAQCTTDKRRSQKLTMSTAQYEKTTVTNLPFL
ncbi:hypothetical protein DPMN_138752 [Dreissena polymorpha]|uniref:Uncharacterized protein n=1 Tax=Dreissena polymorpha TaxID=45954 RepID=A0A9D4G883_DREPO|nr:hypothetical protein DPMN_138752 [Dreissena polymorpha]